MSRYSSRPGDIVVGGLFAIHNTDEKAVCEDLSITTLQESEAVRWIITMANSYDFIPGVNIGYRFYDTYTSPRHAIEETVQIVPPGYTDTLCSLSNETGILAGILGPSISASAELIAKYLKGSNIPLLSYSATLSRLNDRNLFPNFYRTALADKGQVKVMSSLIDHFGWSYIVLVHQNDNYGIEGIRELVLQLNNTNNVCVAYKASVTDSSDSELKKIIDKISFHMVHDMTGSVGVIYFGQSDVARSILSYISRRISSNFNGQKHLHNIQWIMSDAVSDETLISVPDIARFKILVVSPAYRVIDEFKQYWVSSTRALKEQGSVTLINNDTSVWLKEIAEAGVDVSGSGYTQSAYLDRAVDATIVMLTALRKMHQQKCRGFAGMCVSFKQSLESDGLMVYLNNLRVDSSDVRVFANVTWLENMTVYADGQINSSNRHPDYYISINDAGKLSKKGEMLSNGTLKMNPIDVVQSTCKSSCPQCIHNCFKFSYIPGDVLILSFYSIHQSDCLQYRYQTCSATCVESFLYTIQAVQNSTGNGLKVGGLAFDDCYNVLRGSETLLRFFSGDLQLFDPSDSSRKINPNSVVAVIGGFSSTISIQLARFLTFFKIPQISYGSTSTRLGNTDEFPYFLRTVRSNSFKNKAMVQLLKMMEWNYISVIFTDNAYGKDGAEDLRRRANEQGICVAVFQPIPFDHKFNQWNEIIQKLRGFSRAKTVVLYADDFIIKGFLQALKYRQEDLKQDIKFNLLGSDSWANDLDIIKDTGYAALGAITLHYRQKTLPEFHNYFVKLNTKTGSAWFSEYWQNHFGCNLMGSFDKRFDKVCTNETLQSLPITKQDGWVRNSYWATYTAALGIKKMYIKNNCKIETDKVACIKRNMTSLLEHIKKVCILTPYGDCERAIQDDGNGTVPMSILNIQLIDNTLVYKEVGFLSREIIQMSEVQQITFYDKYEPLVGKPIPTRCVTDCPASCSITTAGPSSSQDNTVTIAATTATVAVVLLVVIIVLVWCRFRREASCITSCKTNTETDEERIRKAVLNVMIDQGIGNHYSLPRSFNEEHYVNHEQHTHSDSGVSGLAFRLENPCEGSCSENHTNIIHSV